MIPRAKMIRCMTMAKAKPITSSTATVSTMMITVFHMSVPEQRVTQHRQVVGQADELLVTRGRQPVPEQRQVERLDHRVSGDEHHQGPPGPRAASPACSRRGTGRSRAVGPAPALPWWRGWLLRSRSLPAPFAHSRALPCRTSEMNVAELDGVLVVTELAGCHVLCTALEMSLQYGEIGRGPAALKLVRNAASSGVDTPSSAPASRRPTSERHVAGLHGVLDLVLLRRDALDRGKRLRSGTWWTC